MKFADVQKLCDAGLVTEDQRQKIVEHYKLREDDSRFLVIISFLGAVLVAAGLVLLIAANWDAIPRGAKLTTGLALMLGAHAGGWWLRDVRQDYRKSGEALHLVGSLLFLGNIALVDQIYHLSTRPPLTFLLWWAGIAALPWLLRSKAQHLLALLAFGIWFGFEINQADSLIRLRDEYQVLAYSLLGLVYIGFGYVLRRGVFASFAKVTERWCNHETQLLHPRSEISKHATARPGSRPGTHNSICHNHPETKNQNERSNDMRNPIETNRSRRALALPALAALIVLGLGCPAGAGGAESGQAAVPPQQQKRIEAMKKKGPDASLTILPVRLAGQPFDRVTEVVGMMLEKQGLKNIELGKSVFKPADKAGLGTLAGAVGEFVKMNPVATDYALYAELNGNHQTGLTELRAVVVDKAGAVVWTDRQAPEDAAFKKLGSPEPLSLCVLLVERLGPQLGLTEATAKAAKPGKMARIMAERGGLPPEDERSPLEERQKEMKKAMPKATLQIFPVRVGGKATDAASATALTGMVNKAKLCKASPAGTAVLLKSSQADPNEQKVLWDLAREFRDYARKNPAAADYVLYADYVFNPQRWEQGYVHFVVCDRKGEWVLVDLQNSHHPDYQSIKPTSRADCDKLLFKRLAHHLR